MNDSTGTGPAAGAGSQVGRVLAGAVPPLREPPDRLGEVRARVRRTRWRAGAAAAGAVVAVAALAVAVPQFLLAGPPATEPAAITPGTLYQGTVLVLETPGHGPRVCPASWAEPAIGTGDVATSPTCQGPAPELAGWDWSDAPGAQSDEGSTWGTYQVVGSWDGERFTLTEPPQPGDQAVQLRPEIDFSTPCPEPSGGWQPVEPALATTEALDQVLAEAEQLPAFAGAWVDQPASATNDPTRLVLNLMFTGELDEWEQWARERWGGALCVTAAEHGYAELLSAQDGLLAELPYPDTLSMGIDVRANAVVAEVLIATPELQRELDQRYGAGAVVLSGWLEPAGS